MESIVITAFQAKQLLEKDGKITMAGIEKLLKIPPGKKKAVLKKANKNLSEMKLLLRLAGFDYVEEYRFDSKRKWRFDLAIPEHLTGIEYEGLYCKKSRHTTMSGFNGDIEKYNAAAAKGWTVLRYTAKNFTRVVDDLEKLVNQKKIY